MFSSLLSQAQSVLNLPLDGSEKGKPLSALLKEIGKKNHALFYFRNEWIDSITIKKSYQSQTLADVFSDLFENTDLSYLEMYPQVVVLLKDPTQALLRKKLLVKATIQQKKIVPIQIGKIQNQQKNQALKLSGQILDKETGEPLPNTTIQVSDLEQGVVATGNGYYEILLKPGVHVLSFSFVNYETKVIDLLMYESGQLKIEMEKTATLLDEVIIQTQATQEISISRPGQTTLAIQTVKRSPALLGEADLIKQVQNLPGVTTVGEAASGFNVRGGSVDQNLILYDGIPAFNSSHVFGFLSNFNSEAIRDITFYKGGIPAEYGGRASSVLDIQSRDGNFEKWNGKVGIGMITSSASLNGPIKKSKTSLSMTYRSTYSDWLVHSIKTNYADLGKSSVFFNDGSIKLTHKIGNQSKLSFSGYFSKDAFKLMGDSTYQWNTIQGSVRLDHPISEKINAEFFLGMSSYGYDVVNADERTASQLSYRITSTIAKAAFNYQRENHRFNFGISLTHLQFEPGSLKPLSQTSNAKSINLDKQFSLESALYISDEFQLNDKVVLEGGVRLPTFISFGPASINSYKPNSSLEIDNVSDTLHFKSGQIIKFYLGLEPRLAMRWTLNSTSSLKLGYNRIFQYLHLISNTTAVTPIDIWQPSGYYFKPQRADQISVGYFKDLSQKKYAFSVESFYKNIQNILDFKDGAQLILNNHLETDLLQGRGYSYGIETFFSKNTGRLTWTFNYTFSRSFRIVSGPTEEESINKGKAYPANFDQPHILNLSWKYNLSRRIYFTGNFTYHTGRPVTIPISAFQYENSSAAVFSDRNQYRIPDYHRMDVALVIEGNHKKKKLGEGHWVFSLYNVYSRRNPYTVFFKDTGTGIPYPYQLSIIGTIFPSISYNYRF